MADTAEITALALPEGGLQRREDLFPEDGLRCSRNCSISPQFPRYTKSQAAASRPHPISRLEIIPCPANNKLQQDTGWSVFGRISGTDIGWEDRPGWVPDALDARGGLAGFETVWERCSEVL